ncbi:hypothetical protein GCM10029976_033660 [Kribbella albertanoniae]|uniref:hypothetical protein n=1 Tax=Kribbella albertanoniae TaxID=1266829 RepID=UPI001404B283|nr:hypothetical protein [Kribbella albertanoniae]
MSRRRTKPRTNQKNLKAGWLCDAVAGLPESCDRLPIVWVDGLWLADIVPDRCARG